MSNGDSGEKPAKRLRRDGSDLGMVGLYPDISSYCIFLFFLQYGCVSFLVGTAIIIDGSLQFSYILSCSVSISVQVANLEAYFSSLP